jgi:hypothetical protein
MDDRSRLALHEASHAAASRLLGRRIAGVSINGNGGATEADLVRGDASPSEAGFLEAKLRGQRWASLRASRRKASSPADASSAGEAPGAGALLPGLRGEERARRAPDPFAANSGWRTA